MWVRTNYNVVRGAVRKNEILQIVEDIHPRSILIRQVVTALLPESYSPKLIQAERTLMFMIQKPD